MKISKNGSDYSSLIKFIKLEDPTSWVCACVLPCSLQTIKMMSLYFTKAPGPPVAKRVHSINDPFTVGLETFPCMQSVARDSYSLSKVWGHFILQMVV